VRIVLIFITSFFLFGCASKNVNNNPFSDQMNVSQNIYFESIDGLTNEKDMNNFSGKAIAVLRITNGFDDYRLPWRIDATFEKNKLMTDAEIRLPINYVFQGQNQFTLRIPFGQINKPAPIDIIIRNFQRTHFSDKSKLDLSLTIENKKYTIMLPSTLFSYKLNPVYGIGCDVKTNSYFLSSSLCVTENYGHMYEIESGNFASSYENQFIYDPLKRQNNYLKWGQNYKISGNMLNTIESVNPIIQKEPISNYLTFNNHVNDSRDRYELNYNGIRFSWPTFYSFSEKDSFCHPKDNILTENPIIEKQMEDIKIYNANCFSRENNFQAIYSFVDNENKAGILRINRDNNRLHFVFFDYLSDGQPFKKHMIYKDNKLEGFKTTDFIDENKVLQ
jgi:hypothetical protein